MCSLSVSAAAQNADGIPDWAPPVSGATASPLLASDDRGRAQACLTSAIYYEAATEPVAGQQAVAQVVLNRVRDPVYPKSVCGVIYQGSARSTGCQFSFTCDGSMRRRPVAALWQRAGQIADAALAGFVAVDVGTATHYHAAWMRPWWSTALIRSGQIANQIGGHVFYRNPAAADALSAPYAGGSVEPVIASAIVPGRWTGPGVTTRRAANRPRPAAFSPWGLTVAVVVPKAARPVT